MEYYLAVDIGASSGRHVIGWLEEGRLCIREMYRFSNEAVPLRGRLCWDSERLYQEVLNGMRVCRSRGFVPKSIGVDTWGVDFALLDQRGKLLGDTVAYRDSRTDGMDEEVRRLISDQELYAAAGIQKQPFNTLYQLMAVLRQEPQVLRTARYLCSCQIICITV